MNKICGCKVEFSIERKNSWASSQYLVWGTCPHSNGIKTTILTSIERKMDYDALVRALNKDAFFSTHMISQYPHILKRDKGEWSKESI
jgi:hypothetical protein